MDTGTVKRLLKGKLSTVLAVSVAVGVLVLLQMGKRETPQGFEERVLVAKRELAQGTPIDIADFEAYPVSQITPLPRAGAAVNDQQLHLLTGLRVQTRIARHGLLLWAELEANRPQRRRPNNKPSKIEIIEEQ